MNFKKLTNEELKNINIKDLSSDDLILLKNEFLIRIKNKKIEDKIKSIIDSRESEKYYTITDKKQLMVCICIDDNGRTQEEFKMIRDKFENVTNNIIFKEYTDISQISSNFDIIICDYGGIDHGVSYSVDSFSWSSKLFKMINDNPNVLFIFNTTFTLHSLEEYIYNEINKHYHIENSNVLTTACHDSDEFISKLGFWFNIETITKKLTDKEKEEIRIKVENNFKNN